MTAFRTRDQDTPTTGRRSTTESTGTEGGEMAQTPLSLLRGMGIRPPRGNVRRALA
jgi:hypothetical protein